MILDEMLKEWKAEAEPHRKSVTQDMLSLLAWRNARLIDALMKCREQRDANYDGSMPDTASERDDAELLAILRGDPHADQSSAKSNVVKNDSDVDQPRSFSVGNINGKITLKADDYLEIRSGEWIHVVEFAAFEQSIGKLCDIIAAKNAEIERLKDERDYQTTNKNGWQKKTEDLHQQLTAANAKLEKLKDALADVIRNSHDIIAKKRCSEALAEVEGDNEDL